MPSRRFFAVSAVVALAVAAAVVVRTASEEPPLLRSAQIGPPLLRLIKVGSFAEPVYVTAPPGDPRRLFVVERSGRIWIVRDGRRLPTPFLDLSRVANHSGFENGLLSMAFAPDYGRTGRFYVDYTGKDNAVRVVEYRRSTPDRADPATRRPILMVRKGKEYAGQPKKQQKKTIDTHNGGLLLFGPDRRLYVSVGDGGESYDPFNHSQNLSVLLGKILRIDPRPSGPRPYRIPPDNPFVHRPGARPEIYDYGLRNPWRFAFSHERGMAIADVGESREEEIDFAPPGRAAGRNYGWRVFEGFHKTGTPRAYTKDERAASGGTAPGAISPAYAYKHAPVCPQEVHAPRPPRCGGCSITGGVFVRDPKLRGYGGRYVYGDYCTGHVYSLVLGSGPARIAAPALATAVPLITSFGEDASGHVYVSSQLGQVSRLAPPAWVKAKTS